MLPKKLQSHVNFAHWCENNHIRPLAAAKLMNLAHKAFKANERECNEDSDKVRQRAKMACQKFEIEAKYNGFSGVDWNGLGPTLRKDNNDIYFPG